MTATNEQYFRFPRQLLTSASWKVLNIHELRMFFRVLEEHQAKAGFVNDGLVVTRKDFVAAGVHPRHVKSGLKVLAALGIIVCTRSMGGSAKGRTPNMYAPTFLARDPKDPTKGSATHAYLEIKTAEKAKRIAELHRVHEKSRIRRSGFTQVMLIPTERNARAAKTEREVLDIGDHGKPSKPSNGKAAGEPRGDIVPRLIARMGSRLHHAPNRHDEFHKALDELQPYAKFVSAAQRDKIIEAAKTYRCFEDHPGTDIAMVVSGAMAAPEAQRTANGKYRSSHAGPPA